MAKIIEEYAVIKISRIVKNNEDAASIITDEFAAILSEAAEGTLEVKGISNCVVEIEVPGSAEQE